MASEPTPTAHHVRPAPAVRLFLLGRFLVCVDGAPVAPTAWARRHAAALVKVLALAPGRRMHREQLMDLVWPDDTLDEATPKLHKAAHFARRALGVPGAIVLRGEQVSLLPDVSVAVDVLQFDDLARQAMVREDRVATRAALATYRGELLPDDLYDAWAEARREQLRLRHLDLLRLDGRWEAVLELEPTDEAAHLAIIRRHAANGDRHRALRQFERLDRALRGELGLSPGPQAVALRDELLAGSTPAESGRGEALIGRDRELSAARSVLSDALDGRGRALIVRDAAGFGTTSLLTEIVRRATDLGLRVGQGAAAPVEGAWPYAPVVEALSDLCRRCPALLRRVPEQHRAELLRAFAGAEHTSAGASSHRRLFVAAADLLRVAADGDGVLVVIDDLHDADDASLRLIHHLARATRGLRVCIVLSARPAPMSTTFVEVRQSLVERHGAIEVDLTALDLDQTAQLIRRELPTENVPEPGQRAAHERRRRARPCRLRRVAMPSASTTAPARTGRRDDRAGDRPRRRRVRVRADQPAREQKRAGTSCRRAVAGEWSTPQRPLLRWTGTLSSTPRRGPPGRR